MEKDLVFNVVYTRETVKYLIPFCFSLLKWSKCSFQLVSNGCLKEEIDILSKVCSEEPRLTFLQLPFKSTVSLGKALSYLQEKEKSSLFCFIDSDILATGPFIEEIIETINNKNAVFSALPSWLSNRERYMPDNWHRVDGEFDRTINNYLLGGSYFAVYDNFILKKIISLSGINFQMCFWDYISDFYKLLLIQKGLKARFYDSGKILNIILNESAGGIECCDSQYLCHLGGLSFHIKRSYFFLRIKRIFRKIKSFYHHSSYDLNNKIKQGNNPNKIKASRYYILLLDSLRENKSLPELPCFESLEIANKVKKTSEQIVKVYHEFKHVLQ